MKIQTRFVKAAIGITLGVLIIASISGCASKSRPYEWTSTVVTHPDGTREETRVIKRDSVIKTAGHKMDLAGFGVEETWQEGDSNGPGDSSYKLNSEGAKLTPQSQALDGFKFGAALAGQRFGLDAGSVGSGISPGLQERFDKLEAGLAAMEEVAEALKNAKPPE